LRLKCNKFDSSVTGFEEVLLREGKGEKRKKAGKRRERGEVSSWLLGGWTPLTDGIAVSLNGRRDAISASRENQ